ncbi:MAG: hypothetical protein ACD_65C00325G0002 [uncultured bacterium]|nr:MAG: hypothetical protein ACD_65C00325G0002 [uncultured bacterium]KKT01946.1 MAG: hypothetical protein UV80_C0007G0060 [Candidatus Peregrinibacteria bacterium GW2011_GWF2_43_17]KKT19194.1 MAG: hypothetical protein UW03_C0022G0010 [Candidatus Peregrinibacteria bacterium GW2011_GWA2_43_8]HAU39602.1 hypothetical protein [Candidatus Peregrinibacteria bacterium]
MDYGFIQLKELLPKAVSKYGLSREVRAAMVRDKARHAVTRFFGAENYSVRPMFFKDGVLHIEVDDSAVGQQVFMKKDEIINFIDAELSLKGQVKDVKIRVS